jgi:hypothetical protein
LLEEVIAMERVADEQHEKENEEELERSSRDAGRAREMRKRSMETLGETSERSERSGSSTQGSSNVTKRQRIRQSDTLSYLHEKMEMQTKLRERELDIKERELGVKERQLTLHEDNNERNFQLHLDTQKQTQNLMVALIDSQKELSQKLISFIGSGLLNK